MNTLLIRALIVSGALIASYFIVKTDPPDEAGEIKEPKKKKTKKREGTDRTKEVVKQTEDDGKGPKDEGTPGNGEKDDEKKDEKPDAEE